MRLYPPRLSPLLVHLPGTGLAPATRQVALQPGVVTLPVAAPRCSEGLEAAASAAFEAFGGAGVDCLVHNAGRR